MIYRIMHYFNNRSLEEARCSTPLSDEEKIAIARDRAAHDLAKELLRNAVFEVTPEGHVMGLIREFTNVESDIEWVSVELLVDEFGKTVFLTREEADGALGERKEDNAN